MENSISSGWTLRRSFEYGELAVDFGKRTATIEETRVPLSPTEARLLACLTAVPGAVVRHEDLLRRVWGWDFVEEKGYVKLYISYLRKKLERCAQRPELLISVRGVGYRLNLGALAEQVV